MAGNTPQSVRRLTHQRTKHKMRLLFRVASFGGLCLLVVFLNLSWGVTDMLASATDGHVPGAVRSMGLDRLVGTRTLFSSADETNATVTGSGDLLEDKLQGIDLLTADQIRNGGFLL